jgi:hypothetical protein
MRLGVCDGIFQKLDRSSEVAFSSIRQRLDKFPQNGDDGNLPAPTPPTGGTYRKADFSGCSQDHFRIARNSPRAAAMPAGTWEWGDATDSYGFVAENRRRT